MLTVQHQCILQSHSKSKIAGELGVISSKTFYGYQLPAPEWVTKTVKAAFK